MPNPSDLFIGLMSGTSLDGVDGVLADFSQLPHGGRPSILARASADFSADLRAELLALNSPGHDELHRAALAANRLVGVYTHVVQALLQRSGVPASGVNAVGAHGQTVRHRPREFDGTGYTWQINQPALLAERTGIRVVADFRSRDLAAGGQGAPLAPAFHQALFGRPGKPLAALNLGGIANLTLIDAAGRVQGFDCGPANALMDHWCQRHLGQPFDAHGEWAASGQVHAEWLSHLLAEPYFQQAPPKSTGRDLFNPEWLAQRLAPWEQALTPMDVQATLAELTAASVSADLQRLGAVPQTLVVCGGGALNWHLLRRLQARLPGWRVVTSDTLGVPAQQVEATGFAWLARQTVLGLPGNQAQALVTVTNPSDNAPGMSDSAPAMSDNAPATTATGAQGARVLGCIYPA